jgi:hypothetical protein
VEHKVGQRYKVVKSVEGEAIDGKFIVEIVEGKYDTVKVIVNTVTYYNHIPVGYEYYEGYLDRDFILIDDEEEII